MGPGHALCHSEEPNFEHLKETFRDFLWILNPSWKNHFKAESRTDPAVSEGPSDISTHQREARGEAIQSDAPSKEGDMRVAAGLGKPRKESAGGGQCEAARRAGERVFPFTG